eukprot:gb/GECG01015804.1/.p1 GENE.gb/GECG01015804.1/~~gb/GECG01015804.1/.p1  ORF type:complete len:241 (+),score=35.75 gb/GECG01015804.1/:1-723(+)
MTLSPPRNEERETVRKLQLVLLTGMIPTILCVQGVNVDSTFHQRNLQNEKQGPLSGGRPCGLSDAKTLESLDRPPSVVRQAYPQKDDFPTLSSTRDRERELSSNGDESTDTFLPIGEAEERGETDYIRIKLIWDVIDSGDHNGENHPRQCNEKGDTVEAKGKDEPCNYDSNDCIEWECNGDNVVNPKASAGAKKRYSIMKERTEWAKQFWERTVRLKPINDSEHRTKHSGRVFIEQPKRS